MKYFPPSNIYLYALEKTSEKSSEKINIQEIYQYIKEKFNKIRVEIREEFFKFFLPLRSKANDEMIIKIARKIADAKVRDIKNRNIGFTPLPIEVEYEKRLIKGESKAPGIIYDGLKLCQLYRELIPENERTWKHCHIVFTNRLFATWDESERRYHARVSIYGFPCIISTTGIVEAPAKPREFYLKLRTGADLYSLKKEFKDRFIDYDDERMTEVMKGYILQAIFFHSTGEAFCNDINCRLYNSHWQEEVIQSQLRSKYELCPKHQKILKEIGGG